MDKVSGKWSTSSNSSTESFQELVIGRVRSTPNFNGPDADIVSILPFAGSYLQFAHDDRYFIFAYFKLIFSFCRIVFQFEGSWDSSLHRSDLLNKYEFWSIIANKGAMQDLKLRREHLRYSLSLHGSGWMPTAGCKFLQHFLWFIFCSQFQKNAKSCLSNDIQVITRDLCLFVQSRDSKFTKAASQMFRSVRGGGISKHSEMNRVPGVYEMILWQGNGATSPGLLNFILKNSTRLPTFSPVRMTR